MSKILSTRSAIEKTVAKVVRDQPIIDIHTHLYPPVFGDLMLWGLDELLTYHYLIAEVFRVVPATGEGGLPYEKFWQMPKSAKADHIWKHLFVERTPISEACRGVLTCLEMLGLDVNRKKDLTPLRKWFARQNPDKYIDHVMQLANIESITMTNNVFDDTERALWLKNPKPLRNDPRFKTALRIDPFLSDWPATAAKIKSWGYKDAKQFLNDWLDRQQAIYVAMSVAPDWRYPSSLPVLDKIILPILAERNMPLAMMIGCVRGVNPALRDAADSLAQADVSSIARLCDAHPQNKFLITCLSRENQHELCITARKFGNLMPFGCWWFLNNPSLIEEITRMRMELLGTSMIPQHSDCRVLDQLLYKWKHSRAVIGKVLIDKYADLLKAKWPLTESDIKSDIERLFKTNFENFLAR